MTINQPDRLDQIQRLIADFITVSTADREASNERFKKLEESNVAANARMDRISHESNERLTRLEQLTSSNAQAIQALTDDLVTFRLTTEQANQEIKEAVLRLTEVTEGIANLVSSLDSDRPTILRKLNSVENKLDRLLERSEDNN